MQRKSDKGVTAVSTGLLIGLISIVALVVIQTSGSSVNQLFVEVGDELGGVVVDATGGGAGSGGAPTPTPAATPVVITTVSGAREYADGSHAESCLAYLNPASGFTYSGDTGDGVYRIDGDGNGSTVLTWCDMTTEGGGWTLVSSNSSSETLIPGGTGRNSTSYLLNASNGLDTDPDPTGDYMMGPEVDALSFADVRIAGTISGGNFDFMFPCSSRTCVVDTGSSGVVTNLASPSLEFYDDLRSGNNGRYCKLDTVAQDVSLNANSNQSTVGASCGLTSDGDPSGGTYVGHGGTEGSFEGTYRWSGGSQASGSYTFVNASEYTSWVR